VHGVYNALDFTFYFATFINVTLNFNIEHVQPHLYILLNEECNARKWSHVTETCCVLSPILSFLTFSTLNVSNYYSVGGRRII
jgi:hypothetical protein